MNYWKWVLFGLLFLLVASDSALLARDTIPQDLCVGWIARQGVRVIEFPGIFLFEKINPSEFYLDQPRNRIAAYVFCMDFLIYLVVSAVAAVILEWSLRRCLQNLFFSDSRLGFVFGAQSVILALGGLFAVGHVFGFLAAICGQVGILHAGGSSTGSCVTLARIGRAAGIILVIAWTLGIYFASPFMSV
jgi:hypothetical protein